MKTTTFFSRIFIFFLLIICVSTVYAQGEKSSAWYFGNNDPVYATQYIGASAGFGWDSSFGNDETTICFGADYLRKLNKKEDCGAYYGGFGNYHNSSQDDFKRNIFKVGLKAEYHYPITRSKETQLIGGLKGFYKFGDQENFGFDEDITGYGGEFYTGVNIRLNSKLDIGLELPIFNYTSVTFDNGSNENTEDFTSFALNKRNPAMAYARFRIGSK
jgi:hypothetical protein